MYSKFFYCVDFLIGSQCTRPLLLEVSELFSAKFIHKNVKKFLYVSYFSVTKIGIYALA